MRPRRVMKLVISWILVLVAAPAAMLAFGATAARAGGSCHSTASAAQGTAVALSQLCFGPTVLYVKPGETVTWTNSDSVEHTVTGLGFLWGSGESLPRGHSVSYRFDRQGVYPYECILHPGMVASVVVGAAGSPRSVKALAAPVLAIPSSPAAQPAAADQPAPATVAAASSSFWRVMSIAALALLLVAAVTIVVQRQRLRHGPSVTT